MRIYTDTSQSFNWEMFFKLYQMWVEVQMTSWIWLRRLLSSTGRVWM